MDVPLRTWNKKKTKEEKYKENNGKERREMYLKNIKEKFKQKYFPIKSCC